MNTELRNKILEIASKEIGYVEIPKNKTKYGKWFGLDGEAWCGIFCSWVFDQGKANLGKIDYLRGFAGTQYAIRKVEKWGKIVSKEESLPGDLVFFDWDLNGRPDHVGILKSHDGKTFTAIEGNTAIGNDSHGGKVMLRDKRSYKVAIFVRPNVYKD